MIGRRTFLATAAGAIVAGPALAQRAPASPIIGWVGIGNPATGSPFFDALRQGLADLGYVEGESVLILQRWAAGADDPIPEMAEDLIRQGVQVIVVGGAALHGVRRIAHPTPVVFGFSGDPVVAGLADSLARPGGRYTGATFMSYELNAKRLQLLHEAFPHIQRVAILANPSHPGEAYEIAESRRAAELLELELEYIPVRSVAEIDGAAGVVDAFGAQALVALPDALVVRERGRILAMAGSAGVPVISGWALFAHSGALLTYGPNLEDSFRGLAPYVDRILKGADPAELPIQQPSTFELVINLDTADALGIEIPPKLLIQATELIE